MTTSVPSELPFRLYDDDGLAGFLQQARLAARRVITESAEPSDGDSRNGAASVVRDRSESSGVTSRTSESGPDLATIQAIRDLLQATIQRDPALRWIVNPFSPAQPRYEAFVALIRDEVTRQRLSGGPLASMSTEWADLVALYADAIGWGPAQPYLDDPHVNEVKIVGTRLVVQERGRPYTMATASFPAKDDVIRRVRLLASLAGVTLDASTPQLTIPVPGGTRIHATIPPLADDTVLVNIRRGRDRPWMIDDLLAHGAIHRELGALFHTLVLMRCSILVAGATASGKTTVLEALANAWAGVSGVAAPHIVSVEDYARELVLHESVCWTPLRTTTPEEYDRVVKEALRQTPDLFLAGEIRGVEAASVITMLQTGHPVMTTIHAADPASAMTRLATLAAGPQSQKYANRFTDALRDAAAGFDIVVMTKRDEATGQRYISEVAAVNGVRMTEFGLEPVIVPLAMSRWIDGQLTWDMTVSFVNGRLEPRAGASLPSRLQQFLPRVERMVRMQASQLSQEGVQRVLAHVTSLVPANLDTAIQLLQQAWREFADPQVARMVRTIVQTYPDRFAQAMHDATGELDQLARQIRACQWEAARDQYQHAVYPNVFAAILPPPIGQSWQETVTMIRRGIQRVEHARRHLQTARQWLDEGNLLGVQHVLEQIPESELPLDLRIAVTDIRIGLLERQQATAAVEAARQYRRQLLQTADMPAKASEERDSA